LRQLVFKNADIDAVTACMTKLALTTALSFPIASVKGTLFSSRQQTYRSTFGLIKSHHCEGPVAFLNEMVIEILAKYRTYCSSQSSPSQLILPEALKTLPLYMLGESYAYLVHSRNALVVTTVVVPGLMKHPSLIENTCLPSTIKVLVRGHERAYQLTKLLHMDVAFTISSLYPKLYPLHALDDGEGDPDDDGQASTSRDLLMITLYDSFMYSGLVE